MLRPVFISRTKEGVLKDELPEKLERIVFCEPSELQKQLYQHILEQPDFVLLKEANAPCDCGVNLKYFLEYQQLQTKAERVDYTRKHKNDIIPRAKCCYRMPEHEDAVIWHSQHPNKEMCINPRTGKSGCPYCIGLPALTVLYKLCSHAALLQAKVPPNQFREGCENRQQAETDFRRAKVFIPPELLEKMPGGTYFRNDGIMNDHFSLSGKMLVLDKLLRTISRSQGRVLLFSYSTQMLDLIQNYVKAEGHVHLRMDGSTTRQKRNELVEEFKRDNNIFLFLLSTKAMGLGLNLTEANYVIIFDVEWNPSWDAQAQDRAYRIGQDKDVKVFRLVSRGTIEEQKYLRQVYKTQLKQETIADDNNGGGTAVRLFNGVQGDADRKGELFGLANLLKFKDGTFMNYGSGTSRRENRKYEGLGIHSTDAVMEKLKEMSEEEAANFCGEDDIVFDNLATRTVQHGASNGTETLGDDDDGEQVLGEESQVAMDAFSRIQLPRPPNDYVDEGELYSPQQDSSDCPHPSEGKPGYGEKSTAGKFCSTSVQPQVPPETRSVSIQPVVPSEFRSSSMQPLVPPKIRSSLVQPLAPPERTSLSVQPLLAPPETCLSSVQTLATKESPVAPGKLRSSVRQATSEPSAKQKNVQGVSSTRSTSRKKSCTKGATTFSVHDLALPSGRKKKKRGFSKK